MKSKQPERSFSFLRVNQRKAKPRTRGLTEIRGPYYSVVGRRYLEDLFELMGEYVDSLKFAGGSFALMPETAVRNIIDFVIITTCSFPPADFRARARPRGATLCGNTLPNVKGSGSISSRSQRDSSPSQPMIGCGLSNWSANPD
jgi:hypothetical protein